MGLLKRVVFYVAHFDVEGLYGRVHDTCEAKQIGRIRQTDQTDRLKDKRTKTWESQVRFSQVRFSVQKRTTKLTYPWILEGYTTPVGLWIVRVQDARMPLIVFEHDWNNAALAALHPCMCLSWSLNFMYEHGTSTHFLLHYAYLSTHARACTHIYTHIHWPTYRYANLHV